MTDTKQAKCKFCGSLGVGVPKDQYGYCVVCNKAMDRHND